MNIENLCVDKQISDSIFLSHYQDIELLCFQHPKLTGAISLHGGHLVSFKPKTAHQDLIWVSERALFEPQSAIRGGIPVCFPWFSKLSSPSHGFVRTMNWELVRAKEQTEGVSIELVCQANSQTLEVWPYLFELKLKINLSEKADVSLVIKNTDQKVWRFSGALHSYFNIGDIHQIKITGMGDRYTDNLNQNKLVINDLNRPSTKELKFSQETDRVYTQPSDLIQIHDQKNNRIINVKNKGHNSAVIWNPWKALSHSMADMSDDSYQTMVCVESCLHALSIEEGYEINPNESYTLATQFYLENS